MNITQEQLQKSPFMDKYTQIAKSAHEQLGLDENTAYKMAEVAILAALELQGYAPETIELYKEMFSLRLG